MVRSRGKSVGFVYRPQGSKKFCMLNSAEHGIYSAHKC